MKYLQTLNKDKKQKQPYLASENSQKSTIYTYKPDEQSSISENAPNTQYT